MRGVPLLMYSRIRSSSPPSVSRDNTGPYCRVRCCTRVWQTPQDWLKRRNPSRWVSLNDASGAPCAKAPDADATTNAATKTPRGIADPSECLQPSYEPDCANLTPWGGGVERGVAGRTLRIVQCLSGQGRSLRHGLGRVPVIFDSGRARTSFATDASGHTMNFSAWFSLCVYL